MLPSAANGVPGFGPVPRDTYAREERPNTGLAEISLLPAECNSIKILIIYCFTTADINYIQQLQKGIMDIEKIVLYKPVLFKDLKSKIDSLLLLSRQEEVKDKKLAMMVL